METTLMAKKKATGVKGKPSSVPRTVVVRGTGEWADWVERGAKHCRTDVSKLIDAALAAYLRDQGFSEPPPERMP